MITMLKRHEIQFLRGAGHKLKQIAKKVGVSERSVRRIAKESPVVTVSHGEARTARRVGRPSTVEAFRKSVEEILSKDPGAPTVEVVRLVRNQGYDGEKSALYELVRSLRKSSRSRSRHSAACPSSRSSTIRRRLSFSGNTA
jgi:transposase